MRSCTTMITVFQFVVDNRDKQFSFNVESSNAQLEVPPPLPNSMPTRPTTSALAVTRQE